MILRTIFLIAMLVAVAISAPPALAAPKAELWERWTAHDPQSAQVINHSTWDKFLKAYVSKGPFGVNRVAYGRVTGGGKESLDGYLRTLVTTPASVLTRDEQRAFWINLYNALTVKVVLDHYPVESIRDIDISPGLFSDGPWGRKLIRIEGEPLSLDDIEHRILRPIWRDARIHYVLNCAAMGCPNLQPTAFTAANTESLLSRGAREFVNHPRGARFEEGRLIVSSIYEWYKADFGGTAGGVVAHLKRYAAPDLLAKLEKATTIDDHEYFWDLNDQAR